MSTRKRPASTVEKADKITKNTSLQNLFDQASVIVCAGSGGVGKTTTAAALAIQGAYFGKRTVVITIDPAKRLADALGIEELSNTPKQISGTWDGELWAMMLDPKTTFDDLVTKTALSSEQASSILQNRFYKNISEALSGTQEYMAAEKLYELAQDENFDLIIIDTPPTRNALDFLEAPKRLVRFLDHKLYRILTAPTRGIVKAASFAAQTFLRTVSKIVGTEPIQDALAFFSAFEGMDQGFKKRADDVDTLLRATTTHYLVITSPRQDTLAEAAFFIEKLQQLHITTQGIIINRLQPSFGAENLGENPRSILENILATSPPRNLIPALENAKQLLTVQEEEQNHIQSFMMQNPEIPLFFVPLEPQDIHTITQLTTLGEHLLSMPESMITSPSLHENFPLTKRRS